MKTIRAFGMLLAAASSVIMLSGFSSAPLFNITVEGRVTSDGSGVAGVAVTDGRSVVTTDAKGRYRLDSSSDAGFVYYTLPAGYYSPREGVIPQFFSRIDPSEAKQKADFELLRIAAPQDRHAFMVWADPQVLFEYEFTLLEEVAADMRATALSFSVPVHAISAGDNVFDKPGFFGRYKEVASVVGVPFYQSLGNHDMDYNERSDELSDRSYTDAFGPSYYSFNVGRIHYVVLNDVFYFGHSYQYMGYIPEKQLRWLEQDLALIPDGSTVVLTLHIPTRYGDSPSAGDFTTLERNSVMNNKALYAILEPYQVHIMAGHSHIQWNTQIADNILEHTHGAASAAWWQGDVCLDGTPKGYTVYEADGNRLSWYFKGVGMDRKEQMRVCYDGNELIANVFNYDPQWEVVWRENGETIGAMERYWGADPLAKTLYPPGGNKIHSWLSYGQTDHLFRAVPVDAAADIEVVATDRFGNVYTGSAPRAWELVWNDEFDYEGLPDGAKWSYDTDGNAHGWGNAEAQFYTSHEAANAFVSDGVLSITALRRQTEGKEYTSARLRTKGKGDWLYGKVEVRAKLPVGRGAWPAIWMLPTDWEYGEWPDSGEIDIMENVGFNPDTVLATAHTRLHNHMRGTHTSGKYYLPTGNSEFHVYGLEWDENEWRGYIDGNLYYTYSRGGGGSGEWPFDRRFHLILNLAVGGAWGGCEGIDDGAFPMTFTIDYVRVYRRAAGLGSGCGG